VHVFRVCSYAVAAIMMNNSMPQTDRQSCYISTVCAIKNM